MGNRTEQSTAVETLRRMGYEWKGGALWKPPLGEAPGFVKEWNGEGLPPVGCEVMGTFHYDPSSAEKWIIKYISKDVGCYMRVADGKEYTFATDSVCLFPIESPERKQKRLILERYPQATRAAGGVRVGDVLISHVDVAPIIATQDIIERFDSHDYYWVIANVGDGYHFISDIKQP